MLFSKKSTIAAYTSLVDVLGCTILKLHDFLLDVINNRNHSGPILLQSMKCLECLIQISPYQKMINDHIIVRILRTVRDFIEHSGKTRKKTSFDLHFKVELNCV